MSLRMTLRLAAPIMALSIVPLAVGVLTAWNGHRSQKNASEALDRNVHSMRAAEELAIGIRDVRTKLDRYAATGKHSHYVHEAAEVRRELKLDHWLGLAESTAFTQREKDLIARVRRGYQQFFADLEQVTGPEADAVSVQRIRELSEQVSRDVLQPAQEYLDFIEEEIAASNEQNQKTADQMALGLLLLGVCGPVAGLLVGYGIAIGINRSIVRLSMPIRDAAGKLNEVVGPITFSAGLSLEELEGVLRKMSVQIGAIVERFQQSQREALRAEQLAAVGQMAAGMAHELRNPLMSMKILVQSAAECNDRNGLGGHDLLVLEEEMTRLEQSIQTFLDFARPPQLEKRTFAVQDVIAQTVNLVVARAEQQGVVLNCRLPPEPILIQADIGQLRQVLLNLLLNAFDAVRADGRVEIEAEAEPGGWLTLRVLDNGGGLPAELGTQIFQPFVSTKETGTGLGLSICKRIVESHGGELTAATRPEGGAVFTVRLLLPAESPASGVASAPRESPACG